ncbi:MAG: FHA domain-containing protein [Planctomycetes bacterium]|nr:FHA domain-containing protein [Planctomycetota bacterium]
MPDFKLSTSSMPGVSRAVEITLSGDVTSTNVVRFQEEMGRVLKPGIVIPTLFMHDAGFISSAGFAYLVDLVDSLKRHGGIVVLVDPQPKIRLIMETLGIERQFNIVPDVAAGRSLATEHVQKLQGAPRLVEVLGAQEGTEYPLLGDKIQIGSDPNSTIVLKHHQVERHHAEVFRTGELCFVKDLGTRFGTYLGKKKVLEAPLTHDEIITVATFRYKFIAAGQKSSGLFPTPTIPKL